MHVFFDESGNTGGDLLNEEQPVFALASTCLDEETSKKLIEPLLRQGQKEAKYSKLKGSRSGQNALLEFFSATDLNLSSAKFMQVDKKYYLITHLVDKLIEPTLHERGIDLYAEDAHVRLTNVWYYAGQSVFPNGHWQKILRAFEKALRCQSTSAFSEFDSVVRRAATFTPYADRDLATGLLLTTGRLEEFIAPFRGGVVFDPAPDLFTAMIHKWMDDHPGRFSVTHDRSKPLARNEKFFRALMVDAPSRIIGYGNRKVEMPLRVSDFAFGNSCDQTQLQVADLIAGASVDALLAWSGKRPSNDYHYDLKKTRLGDLFAGGMLAEHDIPDTAKPAPGEISLVDGSLAFLRETGYVS